MASYHVVITGHLDEWRLPPDGSLPSQIHQVYNYDTENPQKIVEQVDLRMGDILQSGAMKAYKDPFNLKVGAIEPFYTIPLHMITHLTHKVIPVTGETPFLNTKGELYVKSGKAVVKN